MLSNCTLRMPEPKLLKNNTMEMCCLIINCGCLNLYDSIKQSSLEFLNLLRKQLSFPVFFIDHLNKSILCGLNEIMCLTNAQSAAEKNR